MTDKRKKRARAIRAKTGVSYASAMNQLNRDKAPQELPEKLGDMFTALLEGLVEKHTSQGAKPDLDTVIDELRQVLSPYFELKGKASRDPEILEGAIDQMFGNPPQPSTLEGMWDQNDWSADLTERDPNLDRLIKGVGAYADSYWNSHSSSPSKNIRNAKKRGTIPKLRDWTKNPDLSKPVRLWTKAFDAKDILACEAMFLAATSKVTQYQYNKYHGRYSRENLVEDMESLVKLCSQVVDPKIARAIVPELLLEHWVRYFHVRHFVERDLRGKASDPK